LAGILLHGDKNMNVLSIVFIGLTLLTSLATDLVIAVRTITQDNAQTAATLKDTITSEVGSLKLSMMSIQEKHTAAVDKVETVSTSKIRKGTGEECSKNLLEIMSSTVLLPKSIALGPRTNTPIKDCAPKLIT
jgi:hypothetical protein